MFELKDHIEKWRREMIIDQSMGKANADELEAHLKDSIEELTGRGLSEEESYWIARHRLGDTRALMLEYSKVDPAIIWRKRLLWLLSGYFIFTMIPSLVKLVALPIYLLDIQWILYGNNLFGERFTFPILLYILILILMGGIFFAITSRRKIFRRKSLDASGSAPKPEFKYRWIIGLLGAVAAIKIVSYLVNSIAASITGTMDFIVSASIFSSLWYAFLFVSMIVIGFLVYRRSSETAGE